MYCKFFIFKQARPASTPPRLLLFLIFLAVLPTRTLHALPPLPNSSIKAGTKMAKKGVELANQMTAEPKPEPLRAPPFSLPWTYGNVPPELE
jgi:hypothetical protein